MVDETVDRVVFEVLGLDSTAQVNDAADIVQDLGAESIDLVEICFRLEKEFKIPKVNPADLFPTFLQEGDFLDSDGKVKESVVARLEAEYPHVKRGTLQSFVETRNRREFVTVRMLKDFVRHRIG